MKVLQKSVRSPLGLLYLVASETKLHGIHFGRQKNVPAAKTGEHAKVFGAAERQLKEYFGGKRMKFDLRLEAEGTPFQKSVWKALGRIPYGKSVSYRDIARLVKNPKAVRAVGSANGKNPLCIVVPCHRVISADGSIGGYSGGLGIKKKLLALELGRGSYGKSRSIPSSKSAHGKSRLTTRQPSRSRSNK